MVVASSAVLHAASMVISAPATNELGLPLVNTTPLMLLSRSISSSMADISSPNSALSVFMLSPGTSMLRIATPLSCLVNVNAPDVG